MDASQRELRFEIPKILLEGFREHPRIVLKPAPGLWPVDMKVLHLLEKMMNDKEFYDKYEILVVQK